jgi:hypothetical protein
MSETVWDMAMPFMPTTARQPSIISEAPQVKR